MQKDHWRSQNSCSLLNRKKIPLGKISKLANAKVLLLGCDFDTNSLIRVPEAVYRKKYNGPIWFDRKIAISYIDYNFKKKINLYLELLPMDIINLKSFQNTYKVNIKFINTSILMVSQLDCIMQTNNISYLLKNLKLVFGQLMQIIGKIKEYKE